MTTRAVFVPSRIEAHAPALLTIVLVAVLAGGIVARVWVLASALGAADADEAVLGLMARHLLDGEFSVFFWLQTYGGSQNALLTAPIFALFGSSVLALKLTSLAQFFAAGVLTWRVGLRLLGPRGALVATAIFWIFPAYFVWFTTRAVFYGFGMICSLAVLLFALRLRERVSALDALGLGLALGLGWWAHPHVALVAVPTLAWLAWSIRSQIYHCWPVLPAFFVSAAPWFAWNAKNGWLSLRAHPAEGTEASVPTRLLHLATDVLPAWFGGRVPFSLEWPLGRIVGIILVAAAVSAIGLAVVRRRSDLGPLPLIVGALPFVYMASPFAAYWDDPRYVVPVAPVLALLIAACVERSPVAAGATLAAMLLLSGIGLSRMERDHLGAPRVPDVAIPADLGPLLRELDDLHTNRVLADYWIAYRITFESQERIIATSTSFVRYLPHDRIVRTSEHPARVFVAGSADERDQQAQLARGGFRRRQAGGFAIYVRR